MTVDTQCGDLDTCPNKPGSVSQAGLQAGLLWRCPRCRRLWRLQHEFSASMLWGLWVWRPAPWFVRLVVCWDRGWWPWAHEVGLR